MYQFQLLLWQKRLFDKKRDVKTIEHEKLHFNCEIGKIEKLDVNGGLTNIGSQDTSASQKPEVQSLLLVFCYNDCIVIIQLNISKF
jgi:hypothetical protein